MFRLTVWIIERIFLHATPLSISTDIDMSRPLRKPGGTTGGVTRSASGTADVGTARCNICITAGFTLGVTKPETDFIPPRCWLAVCVRPDGVNRGPTTVGNANVYL